MSSSRRYAWDSKKAESNLKKHGVTFEEAETAVDDPNSHVEYDVEHEEPRFVITGMSSQERVLVVVTFEIEDDVHRIISARKAEKHERKAYEKGSCFE